MISGEALNASERSGLFFQPSSQKGRYHKEPTSLNFFAEWAEWTECTNS